LDNELNTQLYREETIDNFRERVQKLHSLPFITNVEVRALYGEKVAATLEKLERLNRKKMICHRCDTNCCQEHGCEFYASQFNQCPIYEFRPAICRFHFCDKFRIAVSCKIKELIKELSEIFLYSLSVAAKGGSNRVVFFNPPPFVKVSPELIKTISPLVKGVQLGKIPPEYAEKCINQQIIRYRTLDMPHIWETNPEGKS